MNEKSRKAVQLPSILMVLSLFGTAAETIVAKMANRGMMVNKGTKETFRLTTIMSLLVAILFSASASIALGATTSVLETEQFNYQPTSLVLH